MAPLVDKLKSIFGSKKTKTDTKRQSQILDSQKPLEQQQPDGDKPPATSYHTPPQEATTAGQPPLPDDPKPLLSGSPYWKAPVPVPVLASKVAQNQPTPGKQANAAVAATTSGSLQVRLTNDTTTQPVYAYITGQAIDNNNAVFLLQSDARTPYYPASPSSTGQALTQNVSINLGAPGNTVTATIPRLAGGRIWFSIGAELRFAVNPGPGLVEPSIFNQSDPNINTNFGFMEFTFNSAQVFANISYVDFVGPPISLSLTDTNGKLQHVSGMHANGIDTIANSLKAQTAKDGRRWSSLIVQRNGQNLRILSPNSGILLNPTWFQTYWTDFVNQVYARFQGQDLTVNTQAAAGNVRARTQGDALTFANSGAFQKPSAGDIFSCSTGPFATGNNAERNAIIPRLAAAFNRSTLLTTNQEPNGSNPSQYYQNPTTNHYARIVHAANIDGKGYAFPYDDVTPDGGVPQEGAIFSYSPQNMTVAVGGVNAHV